MEESRGLRVATCSSPICFTFSSRSSQPSWLLCEVSLKNWCADSVGYLEVFPYTQLFSGGVCNLVQTKITQVQREAMQGQYHKVSSSIGEAENAGETKTLRDG